MVGVRRPGPTLEQVHPLDALAEVAPERLLARHEQHVAVEGFVDLIAHALAHTGSARRSALVVVGRVAGDLVLRPLVCRHVSLRYQSKAAAQSDCASSRSEPLPVSRARMTAARIARAPYNGAAKMPIDTCSGMYVNPSSSTAGVTMPAHVS